MKIFIYIIAVAFMTTIFALNTHAQKRQLQPTDYNQKLQTASLLFMENKGQVADNSGNLRPDILFTANSNGVKVYLTATGIHYQFNKTEYPEGYELQKRKAGKSDQKQTALQQIKSSSYRFTLELEGANQQPSIKKELQSTYTENYYLAHCPYGITGVNGYEKIVFENVYPNIDWVLYSKGGFMEYDFLVHPGGNPAQIRLKVKDAEGVSITESGELLMKTSLGEVREKAPVSYAGAEIVSTRFKQFSDGTIGFDVKPKPGKELRIDPSVIWATYYGGSDNDYSRSCTTDGGNNVYLSGETLSTTGIASGGFQNVNNGSFDAFLVKFSSSGTLLWATYYGGSDYENSFFCTSDASGNIYMVGETKSATGIASGGFQNTYGGGNDCYLAKFSNTGTLIWATYYGGNGFERSYCCMTDGSGNVYLVGETKSTSGIASDGFQNTYGGGEDDGFIVKFNSTGSRLWASYYGGISEDISTACAIDVSGNVYLAGSTRSTSGIASDGFQNTYGGGTADCFLAKFSSTGSRLWATYYGGDSYDVAYSCTIDVSGNVYMAGVTLSATGIASGGFQDTLAGNRDGLLVKFSSTGARLWGTYYGGSRDDYGSACITDVSGNVYLSGETSSETGIAAGGFQNTYGGGAADGFIVKFNSSGNRLWASFYGGSSYEDNYFCTVDGNANVYIAGATGSATAIASGGFQNRLGGSYDSYLTKIDGSEGTLPVMLTSIKAYQQLTNIQVEWTVQQESNVKTYEIEKSLNGNSFTKAGEKLATGNAIYQWLDVHAESGSNFYRLRIVDTDGKIKYSQIVKVVISKGKPSYQIYPNPITSNVINLSLINQPTGMYTVRLYNALSQLIFTRQITHMAGSSAETINFNHLSKGNYLLEVTAPNSIKQSFKVIY